MATIRKVADLAGVSTATVSHVINDTRAVSAPLTARVLNAMEQLDYQPDIIARSLRRRETLTLGLIVPSIEIPFFARVAAGVEAAANDVGYSVILCNTGWSLSREVHYLNNLLARRVDGLLCISLAMSAEHIAPVLRRRTPVVVFERTMPGVEVDAVEIDNVQGAFDATAHLLDLGHRRIGCITGLRELQSQRGAYSRLPASAHRARHPVRPGPPAYGGLHGGGRGARIARAASDCQSHRPRSLPSMT